MTEALRHLTVQAEEFLSSVADCAKAPEKEPVHKVRTGSRRVQALVETSLREAGKAGTRLRTPSRRWLKQLKKLRRAAGEVRDTDVQRELLKDIVKAHDGEDGAGAVASQAETVDQALKRDREQSAERLTRQIRKRSSKLQRRQAAWFKTAAQVHAGRSAAPARPAEQLALKEFVRLSKKTPELNAGNLHEFRKASKKARYVAESGGESDSAMQVARQLKEVQDVIGAWHDLLLLTENAKKELDRDGNELIAVLEAQTDRHFEEARQRTEELRSSLLAQWDASRAAPARAATGKRQKKSSQSQRVERADGTWPLQAEAGTA